MPVQFSLETALPELKGVLLPFYFNLSTQAAVISLLTSYRLRYALCFHGNAVRHEKRFADINQVLHYGMSGIESCQRQHYNKALVLELFS